MSNTPLLDTINDPSNLRALPEDRLPALAAEIRQVIMDTVSRTGGHLASNLGVVELTLALHRVFDFSRDALIFDVGHQCYTHKLLTGRREAFARLRQKGGASGFPNPAESAYDPFRTGHASASLSEGLGLAAAARLSNQARNVVAVIGDGSIPGGLAFEALNHAGHAKERLLVILNDNDMAISPTVGAVSGYLSRIRSEPVYQRLREELKTIIGRVPLIGGQLGWLKDAIFNAIKQVVEPGHIFTDLGFRYYGPIDGHDTGLLVRELENLKNIPGPRILHITTQKGRGFAAACANPEKYHSAAPFEILINGEARSLAPDGPSFTTALSQALRKICSERQDVVAITAAMPAGTGVDALAREMSPQSSPSTGQDWWAAMAQPITESSTSPICAIFPAWF